MRAFLKSCVWVIAVGAIIASFSVIMGVVSGKDTARNANFDCVMASADQVHGELREGQSFEMFSAACDKAGNPATGV